jgi:uncharacterized protein involved in exopolysaccharide biosynthesis
MHVDIIGLMWSKRFIIIGLAVVGFILGYAGSYTLPEEYKATTVILPPPQSGTGAGIQASLGQMAALAGIGGASMKTTADQYASLLQTNAVMIPVIQALRLNEAYRAKSESGARQKLLQRMQVSVGKKDGLLTLEVTDTDPIRAALIANKLTSQLNVFTSSMAMTEAQQRRKFFEGQLLAAKSELEASQLNLQRSGINGDILKLEAKSATDAYGALLGQEAGLRARLDALGQTLTRQAPEFRQVEAMLEGVKRQINSVERGKGGEGVSEYAAKYRSYKYKEVLYELLARQFEMAKIEESKDPAGVQIIDSAVAPEEKFKPNRAVIAAVVGIALPWLYVAVLAGMALSSAGKARDSKSIPDVGEAA